jgi:hypothetical protein
MVGKLVTFRSGSALLLVAAAMVGIAIVLEGTAGRLINGAGGVLWFASAAILLIVAIRTRPPASLWLALVGLTMLVAFVVTPSALLPTLLGFVPAGFLIAWLAPRDRLLWAVMIPAWYLPAHIGTAVTRAAIRSAMGSDAPLRTDPPPTASFVPLLMVICAVAGGYLATMYLARHRDRVGPRTGGSGSGN